MTGTTINMPKKTKTKTGKPNLRKEKPMQTKQSVTNSNIRATVIAAWRAVDGACS
jgi:hypothetical protein